MNSHSGKFEPTHPELLKPIIVYDNQKVEALMFYEDNFTIDPIKPLFMKPKSK